MPKTGTRKLMEHIENDLIKNNIKMGRDALFDLLRSYGLLVKKTKRFHITTDSKHFFFKSPNLLKEARMASRKRLILSKIWNLNMKTMTLWLGVINAKKSELNTMDGMKNLKNV